MEKGKRKYDQLVTNRPETCTGQCGSNCCQHNPGQACCKTTSTVPEDEIFICHYQGMANFILPRCDDPEFNAKIGGIIKNICELIQSPSGEIEINSVPIPASTDRQLLISFVLTALAHPGDQVAALCERARLILPYQLEQYLSDLEKGIDCQHPIGDCDQQCHRCILAAESCPCADVIDPTDLNDLTFLS